jgi:hypothetical protein
MTETLVAPEPSEDEAPEGAPFGSPADAGLSPDELPPLPGLIRKPVSTLQGSFGATKGLAAGSGPTLRSGRRGVFIR